MQPVTFNPGPSQVSPDTKQDMREAADSGVLEMSHRSAAFNDMSSATMRELRAFYAIPDDYTVFYTSSATEAMELTIRNLVRKHSFHFTQGSFSRLFQEVSESLGKDAASIDVAWGASHDYAHAQVPREAELITVTYNETSTGVMCSETDIAAVRTANPDALTAVDITSIAAMKRHEILSADIWLFSVQKGFGLPAGLGILIVSPRAMERAARLEEEGRNQAGIFTFAAMQEYMSKGCQTVCTPNVLGIFLFGRQLQRWNAAGGLVRLEEATQEKSHLLYNLLEDHRTLSCFVREPKDRSLSIVCLTGSPELIVSLHAQAKEGGMTLGKGYGKLKETTIRIATFPSVGLEDVRKVAALLKPAIRG